MTEEDGEQAEQPRPTDTEPASQPMSESSEIRQRVARVADVRLDKVERICRKMASGEYKVDSKRLAERILDALDK